MTPPRRRPRPRKRKPDPSFQPDRAWQDRLAETGKNDPRHPRGEMWERIRSYLVQKNAGICSACGHHGGGADGIDHDPVPLSECAAKGIDPFDLRNLKLIHSSRKPCVTCRDAAAVLGNKAGACNSLKGTGSTQRLRQLLADRCGMEICGVRSSKDKPRRKPAEPVLGERDWL